MTSILLGELAQEIGDAFGDGEIFYDATLNRAVTVPDDPFDPSGPGSSTTTNYPCKAFIDNPTDYQLANSLVQASQGIVTVLQTTLSVVPKESDTITIGGSVYTIAKIKADPAAATWEITVNR